jgi:extradiol dioxygenase family protein
MPSFRKKEQPEAPPILHLALPVRDLDEARYFYGDVLGCQSGRTTDDWIDMWFYGCQLTLHNRPSEVLPAVVRGVRHFGVALPVTQWESAMMRFESVGVVFTENPHLDDAGAYKAKVEDPSGNVIEFKAYPNVELMLAPPAGVTQR